MRSRSAENSPVDQVDGRGLDAAAAEVDADRVCHDPNLATARGALWMFAEPLGPVRPAPRGSGIGRTSAVSVLCTFSRSPMPRRPALPTRRTVAVFTAAVTGLVPLVAATAAPAVAAPDASDVVISEVYGGGGSTSSAWNRDYVELYNPTDEDIDLSGTSVQYRAAGGTSNPSGVTTLSGSVPAKGYFLVGEATGSTGAAVPTPAVSGSIAMSGTAGTDLPGRPDHGPDHAADRFGHGRPGNPRPRRVRRHATPSRPQPPPPPRRRPRATRDASGTDTERQLRGPHRRRRHARCSARGRYRRSRQDRPGGGHDRGDPGHRLHQPVLRQAGDHVRRGHGGLPDRGLQRFLPPDRRHRWRGRPSDPSRPPTQSSSSGPRQPAW